MAASAQRARKLQPAGPVHQHPERLQRGAATADLEALPPTEFAKDMHGAFDAEGDLIRAERHPGPGQLLAEAHPLELRYDGEIDIPDGGAYAIAGFETDRQDPRLADHGPVEHGGDRLDAVELADPVPPAPVLRQDFMPQGEHSLIEFPPLRIRNRRECQQACRSGHRIRSPRPAGRSVKHKLELSVRL